MTTTKQKFAQELQKKQERINAWENHGINTEVLDRNYCVLDEDVKVEYWYLE
jgi:hypothetical protein